MKMYYVLLASLLGLFACSTKPSEVIPGRYWKIASLVSDEYMPLPLGDSTNNLLLFADSCTFDNTYHFSIDGKFMLHEGVRRCDTLLPQEFVVGTWNFSLEETFLFVTDTLVNFEYIYTFEEIEEDRFKVTYPNNNHVYTAEFVKTNPVQ